MLYFNLSVKQAIACNIVGAAYWDHDKWDHLDKGIKLNPINPSQITLLYLIYMYLVNSLIVINWLM
jgi:hypothetical protein